MKTRIPQGLEFLFIFRPTPSCGLLSHLRALIHSPAPGAWEEQASVDLRGAGGGLVCSPVPRAVPLSHYVRSLLLSDPQAGWSIAMCAVFVSSFSCHPLDSEDEAAAARSGGWRRDGCVICRRRRR